MEKGKKNWLLQKTIDRDLNITVDKINVTYSKEKLEELGYLDSEISLVFRSKNDFEKIFSFITLEYQF